MRQLKIRFKKYNDVWENVKLTEIAPIVMGQSPDSKYYTDNPNDYILVQGNADMRNGRVVPRVWTSQVTKLAEKGDLILSVRAPVGDVGKTDYPVVLGRGVAAIKGNEFLFQLLTKMKQSHYWSKFSTGSTFESINSNDIKSAEIYLPSPEEQQAIGSLFRILDDLLASYKENLTNYQSLKATMLSKMFPKAGLTVPEIRLDGFEGEWEVQILKEIASFSKGNGYTKNDLVNSGKEIILYGRLYTNYQTVISKVNTFVTTVKANTVISKGGEVIVPASGESAKDISRASVVEKSGIILSGDLNIIYPDENKVDSIFLALTISNGSQQKELIKRAQGKSVVHLRNNDLEKVVLHYPSMEEQHAISTYFLNLDNLITTYQEKISQLDTLKKKLLQDMFM